MNIAPPTPRRSNRQVPGAADGPHEGRSVLPTLNDDGSRRWIKPRLSAGRFLTWRRVVGYTLIAIFACLPLIRIGGEPVILLDIVARRFHLFGATFYPTDTLLLGLLAVSVFVSIFFVTALLGRVWCGWACPQTVYMELLFRPIERLLEGAPGRPGSGMIKGPGARKVVKFAIYFVCCLFLAHTFLAYFVSWDVLRGWVIGAPTNHLAGFIVVMLVTGMMMFDFGYFREQVCLVACPYGRLQSVLLDKHSMIIRYDHQRGEPRGPMRAKGHDVALPVLSETLEPPALGDCIDCKMCVTTCPTGIDIRNGLQMECIGCAQCIDACDAVMDKVHRPRGLIRYSSQAAIEGGRFTLLRARVLLYPAILAVLVTAFAFVLMNTGTADVTVLRGIGRPFTTAPSGEVANTVRVKITNRLKATGQYVITVSVAGAPEAHLKTELPDITVGPGEMITTPAQIFAPRSAFHDGKASAVITVTGPEHFSRSTPFTLLGPASDEHDDAHTDQREHKEDH